MAPCGGGGEGGRLARDIVDVVLDDEPVAVGFILVLGDVGDGVVGHFGREGDVCEVGFNW